MIPVEFREQNYVYGENQEGVLPLPVLRDQEGQVVSCWELSEEELQEIIRTKKLWVCVHTYNAPLQPIAVFGKKSDIIVTNTNVSSETKSE